MPDVLVIGAGAAGLMAGGTCACMGKDVLIIEKNKRPGRKIVISGKGRCNITNAVDGVDGLIRNIPNNGRFLYSAFNTFSNNDIIDFFEENGLETKVERGERVFPKSDNAMDVVDALERYNKKKGAKFLYKSSVKKILVENGGVCGVMLETGERLFADIVILCTGGRSYPRTGSTGDGYALAKSVGHSVTPLRSALVGVEVFENWVKELEGLSLRNVSLKLKDLKGDIVYEDFGEMVFTKDGVSGPVVLSLTSFFDGESIENYKLSIDLKNALDFEKLDSRVMRDFEKYTRKSFKNALDDLLPQKLIPVVIKRSGIDEYTKVNQITKSNRHELVNLLKDFSLTAKRLGDIDQAIVTRGGVSVKEIKPKTMESKLVGGLYFAGEIIDVDGVTGGFNLTIAFSTGYLAGVSAGGD